MKTLYMVSTKDNSFLTESDKPSNLKMVKKYSIPREVKGTWVEEKIQNHHIIKISFFKKLILTLLGCTGSCHHKTSVNRKLMKLYNTGL